MRSTFFLLAALAALGAGPAAAQKPHAHGAAALDVAVEGARLTLALEASLEDFVGFEREPRNERERAAIAAMTEFLESDRAFVPTAAARCRRIEARLETRSQGKGHADVVGAFAFECADAGALAEIDVGLFERFQRLERIDARIVSGKGQSAQRLTPRKRRVAL